MGLWKPDGRAMSVTAADFKNDGKLELLSTNDAMENYYFELNSKGVYEEKAIEMNIAYSENGQGVAHMGPVVGDIDRDGFLDVFIPDLNYCSLLMQRRDGKGFEYRTNKAGLAVTMGQYAGWAAMMFDYDLDGWLDIFTVHGNAHHEYAQENTIVRNRGNGTFEDVSDTAGPHFKEKHVGRGGTGIDFNNDGKMDLVIVNVNDNAILLRNDTRTKNHWITVRPRLKFSTGTRDAYGARVTVKANGLTMIEDMIPTRGYLSAQDPRLNFGLGKADHADAIEIRWPGGAVETHTNVKADQFVTYTHEATATKVGAAKVQNCLLYTSRDAVAPSGVRGIGRSHAGRGGEPGERGSAAQLAFLQGTDEAGRGAVCDAVGAGRGRDSGFDAAGAGRGHVRDLPVRSADEPECEIVWRRATAID